MSEGKIDGFEAADVAARLILTRNCLRHKQGSFARGADIKESTYNQYEKGERFLPVAAAHKLCDAYDLTFDWLYRGDLSGLRYELAECIKAMTQASRSRR
jgi:transcriptional regulator with XRE-family HTH domain